MWVSPPPLSPGVGPAQEQVHSPAFPAHEEWNGRGLELRSAYISEASGWRLACSDHAVEASGKLQFDGYLFFASDGAAPVCEVCAKHLGFPPPPLAITVGLPFMWIVVVFVHHVAIVSLSLIRLMLILVQGLKSIRVPSHLWRLLRVKEKSYLLYVIMWQSRGL